MEKHRARALMFAQLVRTPSLTIPVSQRLIVFRYLDIRHTFLPVTGSPSPRSVHDKFEEMVPATISGNKPVPVIHSLSSSTYLSHRTATASMDEWLGSARASGRKVPFLWVGPTATDYQKPQDTIGTQEEDALQQYTFDTARTAQSKGMEVLSMYNATSQAASLDGSHYGEKVSLMQAMMVSLYRFPVLIKTGSFRL